MQDVARPHRTREVFEVLYEHFWEHVIGLDYPRFADGGLEWPPYSPDLNPCDFFLWGYLKERIYRHAPRTHQDLKKANTDEVLTIGNEVLDNVFDNFIVRLSHVLKN